MWILNEIESHKKKNNLFKIFLILAFLIVWWYFSYSYLLPVKQVVIEKEYKTILVTTWDLKTSISWDGKVLYKEDYNLNFPIAWTVKSLNVIEWQSIKAWDLIASLDTTYLEINVDKAEIALNKAYADLESKKIKYSSSDIQLSQEQLNSSVANLENIRLNWEIDIANSKSSLETAQINLKWAESDLNLAKSNLILIEKQETEKYENKVEDALVVIASSITFLNDKVLEVDKLLWITSKNRDKNDSFEWFLWSKDSGSKTAAISAFNELNVSFSDFLIEWKEYRLWESNTEKTMYFLDKIQADSKLLNKTLTYTLEVVKNSIPSIPNLTESQIQIYTKDYENNISDTKKQLALIVDVKQQIEEQKTNLDTRLETQNNLIYSLQTKLDLSNKQIEQSVINYENSVKKADNNLVLATKQIDISKASLSTKTEDVSYSELAPYYNSIDNAKKLLEESKVKLQDAILKSPVDWKIVSINGNIWAYVWWDKDTAFVTITNNNKFYVESFVEELDITRIQENGTVYLTFEALEGVSIPWKIYYISDKSTTDNNWIVTYRVEISFEPGESGIREWMTTYVEYITNEVKNVKIIPVWAVKPISWKPSVMLENREWKEVITGFTDWKMVEIISGLEKWDKIIY